MREPGFNRDGRALRTDNRKRHDGVDDDPTHAPGPVIKLDPSTMKPIEQKRINVTQEDAKAAISVAASMSWKEQSAELERLASIMTAKLRNDIEGGNYDDNTVNRLAKLATIARSFLIEARASSDDDFDLETATKEEIAKRLAK